MKNLILHRYASINCSEFDLQEAELFCVDPQTGDLFIYKNGVVYGHLNGNHNLELYCSIKDYFELEAIPVAIGLCYNSLDETLCIAFSHGDILTIDKQRNLQCVGSVQSGLVAFEWSYDQEVIAMVTGENTVIVMSAYFDPIKEVSLTDIGFGEKQFVTVGWGKKETQFHGSEGKSAARSKLQNAVTAVGVSEISNDDGIPRISWRGDGTLFAVSALESNGERCIRVYSRDGVLQYTSEVVAGLEASFAWRPSGNLIAGTQRLPNKHQVAFFEKNGLRHGEFTLPFAHDEMEVRQLSWNGNSTILAILLEHRTTRNSLIQLWTQSNYHWYLKQSLKSGFEDRPISLGWFGDRLDVVDSKGNYSSFEWAWSIHGSRGQTSNDGAFVAVIDGAKLLVSSFRAAVPPPPMCAWQASLPSPVNAVAFAPDESNRACLLLGDGTLAFIDPSLQQISRIKKLKWETSSESKTGQLYHWLWASPKRLLCCCTKQSDSSVLSITIEDSEEGDVVVTASTPVEGSIVSLSSGEDRVIVQLSDGRLLGFEPETLGFEPRPGLPEPCVRLETAREGVLIALSARNRLYVDCREVANNATSFLVRSPFVLITTAQHRLICVRLAELKGGTTCAGEGSTNGARRIERGCRLVTVVPGDTRVVLQTPRGNLETIQPRSLCLEVGASLLDRREYRAAFRLFRRQRINLNLVCDHRLDAFLDDTSSFVEQIEDPTWLSLFFSELREEDVTLTTYGQHYRRPHGGHDSGRGFKPQLEGKVGRVCRAVRREMMDRDSGELYLQPIIASHVREGRTDEALKMAAVNSSALTFLSCMVDVDKLFDTALGLYNLELAAVVAARTQKDPKEYLPFLNKIRKLDVDYQRYVIDEHLKRYELALAHIARCSGEERLTEGLTLVKKHSLYKQALRMYPRSSQGHRKVALAYAEHLTTRLRHAEAAILFRRAGCDDRAMSAFVLAGDWREAVNIAWELGHSTSQVDELCRRRLIPGLINSQRHSEAAQLLAEVVGDVEGAVGVLAGGHVWPEALWATRRAQRPDLVDKLVSPAVDQHLHGLRQQLASSSETYHSQRARLAVVRANRTLPSAREDDAHLLDDSSDLFSDKSSVASRSQATSSGRSSTRSSKNRRKQERKLLSLKEGGAFEDLALIRALHELVTNTWAMQDEVRDLCRILLHFDRDEEASSLQEAFSQLIQEMESSKHEIWTPELANCPEMAFGPDSTTDSIISSLKSAAHSSANTSTSSSLLDPHLRIAPVISNSTTWQLEML